MMRPELVRRKLAQLHGYLSELEPHRSISLQEYLSTTDKKRSIERLLELLVEVTVDLNTHLVTEIRGTPPTDYANSFTSAAQCEVISVELAEHLRPSAGLRNLLVHEYGEINDLTIHAAVPMALDGFSAYSRAIAKWLESRLSPSSDD